MIVRVESGTIALLLVAMIAVASSGCASAEPTLTLLFSSQPGPRFLLGPQPSGLERAPDARLTELTELEASEAYLRLIPPSTDETQIHAELASLHRSVRERWTVQDGVYVGSGSELPEESTAVFRLRPGSTIPGHPEVRRIRLRLNAAMLQPELHKGCIYTFRFGPSGEFLGIQEYPMGYFGRLLRPAK